MAATRRWLSKCFAVVLILLAVSISLPPEFVAASQDSSTPPNGSCTIPKDEPLHLSGQEGQVVWAQCEDGEFSVTKSPVRDGDSRRAARDEEPDESVEILPPPKAGGIGAQAAVGKATCNVRSTTVDNSIVHIDMTRYTLYLAWSWNTNTNRITGRGKAWAGWKLEKKTGWHVVDNGGLFLYQKTKNGRGLWVRQGMEGWKEFAAAGGTYRHEQHIILWVNRDGNCTGENHISGTLPRGSYIRWEIYKTPYTPR